MCPPKFCDVKSRCYDETRAIELFRICVAQTSNYIVVLFFLQSEQHKNRTVLIMVVGKEGPSQWKQLALAAMVMIQPFHVWMGAVHRCRCGGTAGEARPLLRHS
jgi:hypothetical protein